LRTQLAWGGDRCCVSREGDWAQLAAEELSRAHLRFEDRVQVQEAAEGIEKRTMCRAAAAAGGCLAGMSIVFMHLPQLADITALRNIQAAGGDLQLYLIPK
jgi:hypothetical protein